MDDRPVEDAAPALRQSRNLAVAALLLWLTSAWLPWWTLTFKTGGVGTISGRVPVKLFGPVDEVTTIAPHATGVLLVVAAAWVFIRIAGRSIVYEPAIWRRDVFLQTGLGIVVLASVGLWPTSEFGFWGGRNLGNDTVQVIVEQTWMPALGFWLALLAAGCLAAASWLVRSIDSPTE